MSTRKPPASISTVALPTQVIRPPLSTGMSVASKRMVWRGMRRAFPATRPPMPAGSSSDKALRLKGRGLPQKAGGHGDLYAHVRVMLPEHHDPDLEALMKRSRS